MTRYYIWEKEEDYGNAEALVEIKGVEFYKLVCNKEGKSRRFIHYIDYENPLFDDCYWEATLENYRIWHRLEMREIRKLQEKYDNPITFVPLDAVLYRDDNGDLITLADIIPSPESEKDPEAEKLVAALYELNPFERKIIDLIFLENPENKSEVKIAKELGIPQQTLNYRKNVILKKIRDVFGRN